MTLQQIQKDVLVGCLLGDANLQTETMGRTWRLRLLHGERQKEYIEHKYEIFQEFCSTGVIHSTLPADKRTGNVSSIYFFNTNVHDCFRYYGNMFYEFDNETKTFVKKVPIKIHKILNERSLAYWFMDDGAIKAENTKGLRICSEGFSREENERLCNVLTEKFGLFVTLNKQRDSYRLYISAKSYDVFKDLVYEYIHPTLQYKLPF